MKVYGLTGLPGSGKSEVGRVAKERGFPVVRMGDLIWDHVRELGIPLTPDVVGSVAHERREEEGADIWAKKTVHYFKKIIVNQSPSLIFIDGIRSMDEVDYFKNCYSDFKIVGIHSSPTVRYNRIIARKRTDDTPSFQAFQERERRELTWGIAQVIALSDIMITNEGSVEELREKALDLIDRTDSFDNCNSGSFK